MYHLIQNSSGETSGYLTYYLLFESEVPRKDIIVCFQNTGEEDPASLDFLHEQEKRWGLKYHWLEWDFPVDFKETILVKEPTYDNLEKYGFDGMYNKAVLDKIRWDESEVKQSPKQLKRFLVRQKASQKELFDVSEQEIIEMVATYSRCMTDFYKSFGKTRTTLGERHIEVDYKSANQEGLPMLKLLLYLNAVRYVKCAPWVIPNPAQRFSTGNLKIKVSKSFIEKHDIMPVTKYIGIRADEESRYWGNLESEIKKGVQNAMPLYDNGIDKDFIKSFWDKQPFNLAIRDKVYLGNCTYCYLKTNLKRIRAAQERPEPFKRLSIIENAAGDSMKRGQPVNEVLERAANITVTDADLVADKETQMACMCG